MAAVSEPDPVAATGSAGCRSAIGPPAVVSVMFLTWMAWFVHANLYANGGHLIYTFDDAYGHMAIAKHLVRDGVWGFSAQDGFSSGGSSLLWPVLLTAWYAVAGVNDYAPLAWNLLAVVGTIFYVAGMMRRYTRSGLVNGLILAALVFLTPLPTVALGGMEHSWQILIDLVFADLASRVLSDGESQEYAARAWRWLPWTAVLLTSVRYEGLFLLATAGLLLWCRRRWRQGVILGVAGALPITVFGVYAIVKGWYFLPTSLMLKGHVPAVSSLSGIGQMLAREYEIATDNPCLGILILAMAAALVGTISRHGTLWNRAAVFLVLALGGMALQLELAMVGWFYRYEAYLVALGLIGVGVAVLDGIPRGAGRWAYPVGVGAAAILFGAPLFVRALGSYGTVLVAAHNVYEQQFFMAQFVHDFYRGQAVAVNDIGAVSYYGNIKLVDVWGLGTMEVARSKRAENYGEGVLRPLFARRGVRVFIGYDDWALDYGGQLPEWTPVGQWTIPHNVVCGSATVSFYAPRPEEIVPLIAALQAFAPRLPRDVIQAGAYVGGPLPHVLGTYPAETDGSGNLYYWTERRATFYLAPPAGEATLILPITPVLQATGLDVTLNGETVASRTVTPAELDRPAPWTIRVHWRPGCNVLCVAGRGPAVRPDNGDTRRLLFAVGEPRWISDPPAAPATP